MKMRQIRSLAEAKHRVRRGFVVFSVVACALAFAQSLATFWSHGMPKSLGMAMLITAVVALALGVAFLIAMPGVNRYLTASWTARESKESPNQNLESTR